MDLNLIFIIFVILIALAFDFTNGMHDAANSIATVVSTRVLSPKLAVIWAATFNFIAFFMFGTAVAETIGKGMIDVASVNELVILAALIGAICWNLLTWYLGLPSSSSHALIGGYAGAAIVKSGFGVIIPGGWIKTLVFIVLAPALGLFLGFVFKVLTSWILRRQRPGVVNKWSRVAQLFSAAFYSLGHGGNDAQKTMGIITSLLLTGGIIHEFHVPFWVVIIAYTAIALGTLTGGWRIVKTMGQKITRLRPIDGFCAETGGALSIFLATHMGVPVSTTHVITGAVSGVGTANRWTAVHWGVTLNIVWAWVLTIPGAAIIAAITYFLIKLFV
jgi:inorganic phosphate transporter, PiT family